MYALVKSLPCFLARRARSTRPVPVARVAALAECPPTSRSAVKRRDHQGSSPLPNQVTMFSVCVYFLRGLCVAQMRYLLRHTCVTSTLIAPPGSKAGSPAASMPAAAVPASSGQPLPFRTMLRVLRRFQLTDPVVRQRGEHVRYESKLWQRAVPAVRLIFEMFLMSLSFLQAPDQDAGKRQGAASHRTAAGSGREGYVEGGGLQAAAAGGHGEGSAVAGGMAGVDGCVEVQTCVRAVRECVDELQSWFRARGVRHLEETEWEGRVCFRVSKHPTSFHLPLHRALAQLLAIAMKSAPQENSAPTSLALALRVLRSRKGFARCLFEHPLRAQVLSVQVDCLVWVRNGFQLQNHASIYTAQRFRGRDLDMLTLQTAMALATPRDAEHIVPLIVDGFELGQLVRLDCVSPPFVGEVPHHMTNLPIPPWRDQRTSLDDLGVGTPQQQIMCGEEMLRRLITLLSAREYAGDMSPMRRWRMCLIHCLALQDRVHSDIVEWAETCPAACGNEDLLAQVVDLILPEIATRVSASAAKTGLASEVYRLRDACWSEVDVHSLCVRTRKEQHDLEERLYKHAKAHPELYTRTSVSGKAGVARVPWLACHPVPFRRELRGGLANIAQSSSLFRLVFVMLHNAARAFDTVGSAGGPVQGMAAGIVGGMGWEGEPVLTRSSEMLVRQCVHLLFLALDLRQGTGVDASNATGASDVEMSDSHTPGRRAGAASHVGAYYESPPVTCEEEASDMVEAMDLVTDVVQPAQGGGDVEAHVPELYIAEASLNMPLDAKAPRAVDANATGLENFLVYGGGGGGGSPTVPGGGDAAMGGGHTDGLGVRASVLDQLCHSYLINGDGGFEDGEGTRVSHSSVHAVSHRASILSLLARLVKRLPKADDLLAQEGVEMFLAEVASVQHDGCAQALAASGYELLGLQEQGDAEERARMKKMAADRQAQMMAQMKMQQAAAAAHMMLEDDDDEHHAASASKERGDALAQLEGSNCALCQESMEMSGVKWSRWDPANESWVDYSGETSAELERASELFEAGEGDNRVQVLLHGDTYVVDVDRMRQTGPVDEGGVRPGRETRCKVRRIVNETMLLGFSQRSPFATCSASADHGGEVKTRHALVVTLCGHAMHKTCLNRYISLLVARRHHITHGSTFEQAHSIDFDQGEFVCAICRRVANTALPVCRMPALTPAPNSDSRTWHWTDAIGGDAGDDEEGWANMFGWVMCDGGGNPPLCTEGPHGSFWLAMSRADDTGRWTRSQPQSRIASRHETAQPPREGAEKIARLVADQVASLELSSRGRLLDVEDARSRPADDILSPTALLLSTLRHQMAAAVFWGDPPLSPDDEAGRRPPACPPWRVSTSWSWLQAQSRAPQVWVEGGCVLGSSKEDEAEEEEMSEDDQEEFAVANVHRGLAALQAHLRGEEEEEEEEAEAEVIPLVRVRTAQPAREEETMQLLPRNGWNGHDTPGLSVSGGACLLTCDLFLLFTSLLAHQPPNSGDRLMGESDQGGACDAPSAGGSGGEGRGGGGELPMARLVRVLYTAHVTQILVALYDQFLAEARDGAERGEAGAGAAHAADDDATMGDSEGPGAGARGAGGWGLQDMLQRIAEAYLERGRPCSLACLAGMLDRQAAVACGGGAAGAVAGGGGGGLSGDTAPAMRVAQVAVRLSCLRSLLCCWQLAGLRVRTLLPLERARGWVEGRRLSSRALTTQTARGMLLLCDRLKIVWEGLRYA